MRYRMPAVCRHSCSWPAPGARSIVDRLAWHRQHRAGRATPTSSATGQHLDTVQPGRAGPACWPIRSRGLRPWWPPAARARICPATSTTPASTSTCCGWPAPGACGIVERLARHRQHRAGWAAPTSPATGQHLDTVQPGRAGQRLARMDCKRSLYPYHVFMLIFPFFR